MIHEWFYKGTHNEQLPAPTPSIWKGAARGFPDGLIYGAAYAAATIVATAIPTWWKAGYYHPKSIERWAIVDHIAPMAWCAFAYGTLGGMVHHGMKARKYRDDLVVQALKIQAEKK